MQNKGPRPVATIETIERAVVQVQDLEAHHGIQAALEVGQEVQDDEVEDHSIVCQTPVENHLGPPRALQPRWIEFPIPTPTTKNLRQITGATGQTGNLEGKSESKRQGTIGVCEKHNKFNPKAFARKRRPATSPKRRVRRPPGKPQTHTQMPLQEGLLAGRRPATAPGGVPPLSQQGTMRKPPRQGERS